MKAKTVRYEKRFNLGNYEAETVGIELELEDGDKAAQALALAKQFVQQGRPQ